MAKIMLFVDGTWLYANTRKLSSAYGQPGYQINFGALPRVLAEEIGKQLGSTDVDVVRTYLFGSYAANYDLRDEDSVQRRLDFFSLLKEEYHYELETFPINFRGRRLRQEDRNAQDDFVPKEKCVDIALATTMLYFAAIPYAYDIAIGVLGDQDFKPVLQHVRRLGKRVAIASIKNTCSPDFSDPRDEARVKDFDIIWLDDLLGELELKYERHQLDCDSPSHKGPKKVWTTYHPRKGQRFYCEECRESFARQKQELQSEHVASGVDRRPDPLAASNQEFQPVARGTVQRRVLDRGFGFIRVDDGRDYYFHFTDLQTGITLDSLVEGTEVEFEIKKEPGDGKAGAAGHVRVC